jgi:hypothetical protein
MKVAGTSKQCHLQKMPQKKLHIVVYTVCLYEVIYLKIVQQYNNNNNNNNNNKLSIYHLQVQYHRFGSCHKIQYYFCYLTN